jgi:hypothetical protein
MFNQKLALRTWDKDLRVDFKLEGPKFLATSNILHRLTTESALDTFLIELVLGGTERGIACKIEV